MKLKLIYLIFLLNNLLKYNIAFSLPNLPFKRKEISKKLDNHIIKLTTPAIFNYVMNPVVGLVDGYWVSNLGGPIQLAGQGCGDQIFGLFYSIFAFMPLVLTPVISELNILFNKDKIIEYINSSVLFSFVIGLNISICLFLFSNCIIKLFLPIESQVFEFAVSYLRYRSIAFPFVLINSVIFSVFRGMMDFNSALKVNIKAQLFNLIADPIFMNQYGIKGVAIASTLSDIICTIGYVNLLKENNLLKLKIKNMYQNLKYLLKNGIFVQIKGISYNFIYFLINRKTLQLDSEGKISASHILSCKIIELFSIIYDALCSVSSIIIPRYKSNKESKKEAPKRLIKFGIFISFIQTLFLFFFKSSIFLLFTKDKIVLSECYKILPYILLFSSISGTSTIIDGILQGYKHYKVQSLNAIFTLISIISLLKYCKSLSHVWILITVISSFRLPINIFTLKRKIGN